MADRFSLSPWDLGCFGSSPVQGFCEEATDSSCLTASGLEDPGVEAGWLLSLTQGAERERERGNQVGFSRPRGVLT